jgi:lipid-A-disaccharide synthase
MSSSVPQLPFALPDPVAGGVDLLIVAGEHSGDEHAARLVRELRQLRPEWRICALGGPAVAAAGAQLLHDLTATSVVGFVEVLKHYSFFKALFDAALNWIDRHRPRAVCFVDYPGFNLRLAARLRERGLSVKGGGDVRLLYYISPQIWAWKARRRFAMARDLDAMAVIFPFEPACYADTGLPVEFVGHPFLAPDYEPPVRHDPAGPVLLLPGSRVQAVARILPVLLQGFAEFSRSRADVSAVILYPSNEVAAVVRGALDREPGLAGRVTLRPVSGADAADRPVAAGAVLTSSGTMSLHCALAGIPGAIVYRTNPLTYLFARWLVKVDFIGIANLLLREPMYPEFIQGAATPAALATELRACADDPERLARTRARRDRLRSLLAQPAAGTAAAWLVRHV